MDRTNIQDQIYYQPIKLGRTKGTIWCKRAAQARLQNGIAYHKYVNLRQAQEV